MKVSIVVPIYKTEKFLKKCLDSLVNQTLKEIEIILINDGSPDNSEEICVQYLEKYPEKIKYYKIINGGCSNARNYGISKSIGKYIMFVDSDDFVELDFCKKMYTRIEREKLDLVTCNFKLVNLNEDILEKKKLKIKQNSKDNIKILLMDDDISGFIINKIFKLDLIKKYNIKFLENSHMFEDKAFVLNYLLESKKVGFISDILYNYVANPDSVMLTINLDKINDIFISLDFIKKILFNKENFYTIEYKKEIYNNIYINRGLIQPLKMIEKAYIDSNYDKKELESITKKILQKYIEEEIIISNQKLFKIKIRLILCKYFPKIIKKLKNSKR